MSYFYNIVDVLFHFSSFEFYIMRVIRFHGDDTLTAY